MIPIHLSITGFLSYREPAEIDFTAFELACIAGPNGAGKSSILDALTWALFGQARKRDDSLIHQRSALADVALIFGYEGNIYKVRRIKPRDKTMSLEFQILQGDGTGSANEQITRGSWKPLTERTMRETEARIEQTLRMDFETFTNASFFLQGKADQFTQQRPGDRKRILGSILGLDAWESYRGQAVERRRGVESEITALDGRLREIHEELSEEQARRARLEELEANLKRMETLYAWQEAGAQIARQEAARLEEQKRMLDLIARQLENSSRRLEETRTKLFQRQHEQQSYSELLGRAEQIEADHAAWQKKRTELADIEKVAEQYREIEKQREAPRTTIQAERARLEQERDGLLREQEQILQGVESAVELNRQRETAKQLQVQSEIRSAQRGMLEAQLLEKRQQQADQRAENSSLKPEMERLKERIERLKASDAADCPLCGQPLSASDRLALIERLEADGKEMGNRYRENLAKRGQIDQELEEVSAQIAEMGSLEAEIRQYSNRVAALDQQLESLQTRADDWKMKGALRLGEVQALLDRDKYAIKARLKLAEIDAELLKTGYDAAAHDEIRLAEASGRASEASLRELEQARAALAPLGREIAELVVQLTDLETETLREKSAYDQAAESYAAAQAKAPDLDELERQLLDLKEQENRLRMEKGAAHQKVAVLDGLKARKRGFEAEREDLVQQVQLLRQLERAFGKDGVPALLIEQALPEIESKANDTLARLSGGGMSVRFVTQTQYRDRNRDDLRETLDIQISDGAGTRDYEMFSGGEAFRVNFAIRLALSEVLAQRAGARLQTLVIDEGFGSQDALGRQRLIEAINLVQQDFAKILVITHIEELKDAFPTRIEVEKTELGSLVRIL